MPNYPPVSAFANGVTIGPVGGVAGQLVISGSNLVMQGAPGFTAPNTFLTSGAGINTNSVSSSFQIDVSAPGNGLKVAEGTNAKQGTATLVAGTVTVANTSVTANSRIFLTAQSVGGTAGALAVTARTAGTSFTVTSSNAADTSTFAYEIFEPG